MAFREGENGMYAPVDSRLDDISVGSSIDCVSFKSYEGASQRGGDEPDFHESYDLWSVNPDPLDWRKMRRLFVYVTLVAGATALLVLRQCDGNPVLSSSLESRTSQIASDYSVR